jgi:D-arabinose 1-dehydrogenase-like Zn-dependent alcohol dehydrogenase
MGVTEVINVSTRASVLEVKSKLDIYPVFQYIFDPIFNVYIEALVLKLDYFGKYITCGALNEPEGTSVVSTATLVKFILKNASLIGNCLGEAGDLQNAITDYSNYKLQVSIDSIHTYRDMDSFLTRTYYDKNRYGKVICSLL